MDELRKKAESTLDAAALEALGMGLPGGPAVPWRSSSLGRVTELPDTRATAHNALGWALLNQGDAEGARAAYAGRSTRTRPTPRPALNLAALRCRYGDKDGAQARAVRGEERSAAGFDVDPEWRALPMRRAISALAALLVLGLACSPQKVEGSLQELLDLRFQEIKLRFAGDQVAVRWTRPRRQRRGRGAGRLQKSWMG